MSTKHPKTKIPSDVDLYRNPLIGGSKGVTMGQATLDDLEEIEGENTIEGDVANDQSARRYRAAEPPARPAVARAHAKTAASGVARQKYPRTAAAYIRTKTRRSGCAPDRGRNGGCA